MPPKGSSKARPVKANDKVTPVDDSNKINDKSTAMTSESDNKIPLSGRSVGGADNHVVNQASLSATTANAVSLTTTGEPEANDSKLVRIEASDSIENTKDYIAEVDLYHEISLEKRVLDNQVGQTFLKTILDNYVPIHFRVRLLECLATHVPQHCPNLIQPLLQTIFHVLVLPLTSEGTHRTIALHEASLRVLPCLCRKAPNEAKQSHMIREFSDIILQTAMFANDGRLAASRMTHSGENVLTTTMEEPCDPNVFSLYYEAAMGALHEMVNLNWSPVVRKVLHWMKTDPTARPEESNKEIRDREKQFAIQCFEELLASSFFRAWTSKTASLHELVNLVLTHASAYARTSSEIRGLWKILRRLPCFDKETELGMLHGCLKGLIEESGVEAQESSTNEEIKVEGRVIENIAPWIILEVSVCNQELWKKIDARHAEGMIRTLLRDVTHPQNFNRTIALWKALYLVMISVEIENLSFSGNEICQVVFQSVLNFKSGNTLSQTNGSYDLPRNFTILECAVGVACSIARHNPDIWKQALQTLADAVTPTNAMECLTKYKNDFGKHSELLRRAAYASKRKNMESKSKADEEGQACACINSISSLLDGVTAIPVIPSTPSWLLGSMGHKKRKQDEGLKKREETTPAPKKPHANRTFQRGFHSQIRNNFLSGSHSYSTTRTGYKQYG